MLSEERRPQRLADVIGQDSAVQLLSQWLKRWQTKGTADAFLIFGPSGSGKTTLARALANELCTSDFDVEFVNSRACVLETVEGIVDSFNHSSLTGSKWKVAICDEAQSMSPAAQAAWLSALERIPIYRLVIFTTTEPQRFDLIFQSRVKMIEVEPLTTALLRQIIQSAVPDGRTIPDVVLKEIAVKAQGNARAALQELEKHLLITPPEDDEVTQQITERLEEHNGSRTVHAGSRVCAHPVRGADTADVVPHVPQDSGVQQAGGTGAPATGKGTGWSLRPSSTGRQGFIEVVFVANPGKEICSELKAAKFWWSRNNGCWFGPIANLPARYRGEQPQPQAPVVKEVLTPEVPAAAIFDEPPPAIQAPPSGLEVRHTIGTELWSVVHTASNRPIGVGYTKIATKEEAERLMAIVLPLADWTVQVQELHKVQGLKEKLISALCEAAPEPTLKKLVEAPVPMLEQAEVKAVEEVKPPPVTPPAEPEPPQAAAISETVDHAARLRALIA